MKQVLQILIISLSISCAEEQTSTKTDVSTIERSEDLILINSEELTNTEKTIKKENTELSEEEILILEDAELKRMLLLSDYEKSMLTLSQFTLNNYQIVSKKEAPLTSITGIGKIFLTTIQVVGGFVESREYAEIVPASFRNGFIEKTTTLWKETKNNLGDHEHDVPALGIEGFYQECSKVLHELDQYHYQFIAKENQLECGSSKESVVGEDFKPQIHLEIIPAEDNPTAGI